MGTLFNAADIAKMALRQIGAFPTVDRAPDPAEMEETLARFDLLLGTEAASKRLWWATPDNVTLPLVSGTASYSLGALSPALEIVETVAGPDEGDEISLLRRTAFDIVSSEASTGKPRYGYLEVSSSDTTLHLWPTPDTAGWSLRVRGQTYSPIVIQNKGITPHGFPAACQEYLVNRLAYVIGGGPVRKLPESELQRFNRDAELMWARIQPRKGSEQIDRPRFVKGRAF